MHSFALRGLSMFFENRKLEIKENYNSYNEIGLADRQSSICEA